MTGKILLIVHQEHSTPGRVGVKLRARGYTLDIRRTCLGHPLPDTLAEHDGVVIFGGPMSANDGHELDFIKNEIDWLDVPLRENAPFLGLCLGAQLLARNLGAKVECHPQERAEIGYYPIKPTEHGRQICDWPDYVYQWHREGFEIPRGGKLLATGGNDFPNQAYQYGDAAFGVQFHPEVTLAMVHRWTVMGCDRLSLAGTRPRASHFADRLLHDHKVDAWLDGFLDHWLAQGSLRRQGAAA